MRAMGCLRVYQLTSNREGCLEIVLETQATTNRANDPDRMFKVSLGKVKVYQYQRLEAH